MIYSTTQALILRRPASRAALSTIAYTYYAAGNRAQRSVDNGNDGSIYPHLVQLYKRHR